MENPKWKARHEKTNEFIEKCIKITVRVVKYVLIPCFILPKVIISIFAYFMTDLGNDAFDLPFPMW